MKIFFDALPIQGDKLTGIGWCEVGQTAAMARLFPENSYSYTCFCGNDKDSCIGKLKPFAGDNIKIRTASFPGKLYRMISQLLPVPYSRFFGGADITHFFNYIIPPGVKGKTVVTVHDMVYKAYPETVRGRTMLMLEAGLSRSLKKADIIVTDSEFSRSEILKYFPMYGDKIRVVPCGVDTDVFHPCREPERIPKVRRSLGIKGDYFLYVGTIEPRKNLERLINGYCIFCRKVENAPKLVLAGAKGWLYDSIFQRVKKLGLEKKVIFTKYVPAEDMNPLMCGALAFVFPSLYEGFGMPPLEAMACGVPVLASDAASLPEVTGDCAVICDPFSSKSIARGLYRLYSDKKLRDDLSRRGLERAGEMTWERSAEKLYEVYRELL